MKKINSIVVNQDLIQETANALMETEMYKTYKAVIGLNKSRKPINKKNKVKQRWYLIDEAHEI